MRTLILVTLMLLAVPGTALAAPPANDNRADAESIPAFPHTLSATTAEATVERLDPQVSRCGRIESTLWYRIDTAPDGLIALTVKGAAGVAPVLRIYRRTASAIQEVDCASAGPGGSASASLETVRGSSYLVLVGRRPSTPDGGFELRAELFLPPGNDNRAGAQAIPKLPGSVRGTTLGATGDEADPGRCGLAGATVWYRLPSRRDGRILLRLSAAGQLDAAIVVLERVRSQSRNVTCGVTNRRGQATVSFGSRRGATYLIAVGHVRGADPGTFRIDALVSEAAESRRAGKALPRAGVRSIGARAHGRERRLARLDAPRDDVQDRLLVRVVVLGRLAVRPAESRTPARRALLPRLHDVHSRPRRRRGVTCSRSSPAARPRARATGSCSRLRRADDLGVGIELPQPGHGPTARSIRPGWTFATSTTSTWSGGATCGWTSRTGSASSSLRDDGRRLGSHTSLRRRLEPGRYVVAVTASFGDAGCAVPRCRC